MDNSKNRLIFLGLGTNLGDRRANLRRAIRGLAAWMQVKAVSPVYETDPWGLTDQPDFLNICLSATTSLLPRPLLEAIKGLEQSLGREPGLRWGPRLIDIDILFYGDWLVQERGLTLPHPRLAERAFVLAPLADLSPQFRHPQTGLSVADMLSMVDAGSVRRLPEPLFDDGI